MLRASATLTNSAAMRLRSAQLVVIAECDTNGSGLKTEFLVSRGFSHVPPLIKARWNLKFFAVRLQTGGDFTEENASLRN